MKKILIAGAGGFIGQAMIEALLESDVEIVALSRQDRQSTHPRLTWRRCDLFSLKDITNAMQSCDVAFYLAHSMLPSAALSQGAFYDYDLLMADNFVRAGKHHGLKHIIYLGGLVPKEHELSWYLEGRLEVEQTFRSSDISTTVLRSGMIIGRQSSSFIILKKLMARLPVLLCPVWTHMRSRPVVLKDVVKALSRCLWDERVRGKVYDIGGPEVMSYKELMRKTGMALGKKRALFNLNIIPISLSRWWITLVSGLPKDLVYPLILGLKHELLVQAEQAWPFPEDLMTTVDQAIVESVKGAPASFEGHKSEHKDVRSIQRLVLPPGRNAEWVAEEYFRWLPTFFSTLIKVALEGDRCTFYFIHPKLKILILEKSRERSSPDRQLLYVIGGILSAPNDRGRLEFREVLDRTHVLAALHEFRPSLPWHIYRLSQAPIHLIVMRSFGEHLKWHYISSKKVII